MSELLRGLGRVVAIAAVLSVAVGSGVAGAQAAGYRLIDSTMSTRTITLAGQGLTIDEVVEVARRGARVELSPDARRRSADAYGLLLEAQAEGVPIYLFNRAAGSGRQVVTMEGDPLSPENSKKIAERELAAFRNNPNRGYGPEVGAEEIVRAMMVVRANNMTYEAASPQLSQMLLDLLNKRITPVVQSRGSLGEADLQQLADVEATMVGEGEAYYRGVRMAAALALQRAGLRPLQPFGFDNAALFSSNAYATGQAALLAVDARQALDWADLVYAMDLNGMNSSVTPLSKGIQDARPQPWLNWDAARVLEMIRGAYLFDDDPSRILQDAESMRASSIRQGSAWQAWARLRDAVEFQMNTSDHNPAVRVGLSPDDSWELRTPQMMKYYVRGGKYSHDQHGYILSNANWDPYPLANDIEAFANALANMDVAITQRIYRFGSPFFTGVSASEVLHGIRAGPGGVQYGGFAPQGGGFTAAAIWQDIQSVSTPLAAQGISTDEGVGDLEAQTFIKVDHARQAVDYTMDLLGQDILTATFWMDLRTLQEPARHFGEAPTAAWIAFRKIVPWQRDPAVRLEQPVGRMAYFFLKANLAASFYAGLTMPAPPGTAAATAVEMAGRPH
jgi:histidine ammonia-lyase